MIELIYMALSILFQISMIYAISNLSNIKIKRKKLLLFGIILYAFLYKPIILNLPTELSTMVSIIYTSILIKISFKLKIKLLLFYVMVVWIIAILIDIFVMLIASLFSNKNSEIFKYFGTLLISLTFFMCGNTSFGKQINKLKSFISKVNFSIYGFIIMLIIYFMLGLLCINNIYNMSSILLIIFISFSILIFVINFLFYQFQSFSLKECITNLNKNNNFYINIIDEYRILKHNLISNLNGIKAVSNKKTKLLIEDLIEEYSKIYDLPNNFKKIPVGINGIISEKLYSESNEKLKLKVENNLSHNIIEVLNARKYNAFCEAVNIILDNAFEASKNSKEKVIFLKLYEDSNQIILKVINTFQGNIDIDRLGTKNYTSKKNGHGLGLFSILNKKDIKLKTTIKSNKFISVISVNK